MSGYVAGRDLYRSGKVAYRAGERVPADAFPNYQRDALLGNGGLRPAPKAVKVVETEPVVEAKPATRKGKG